TGTVNNDGGFSIKSDVYYPEQRDFIQKCMQTIWNVIYDAAYGDHSDLEAHPYHTMDDDGNEVDAPEITSAYEAISRVIDIDSLVDMYILHEICQDGDMAYSSKYFALDMSEKGSHKLVYTAPWDFDSGLGTNSGETAKTNEIFVMNTANPWFVVFAYQDWFWTRVYDRFMEAKEAGVFSHAVSQIDEWAVLYEEAYARNYAKWQTLGNPVEMSQVQEARSFRSQADAAAYLSKWVDRRIKDLEGLLRAKAEAAGA
ncbi:MAG: CotH kinase family protein, partial [Lachnospiraceae bacterium]|nr:CotH kinase family protein [Lachnospiraceae bacterium]